MTKRIFLISIDTGNEQDDHDISDMLIDLISFLPMGVTYKFVGNKKGIEDAVGCSDDEPKQHRYSV